MMLDVLTCFMSLWSLVMLRCVDDFLVWKACNLTVKFSVDRTPLKRMSSLGQTVTKYLNS